MRAPSVLFWLGPLTVLSSCHAGNHFDRNVYNLCMRTSKENLVSLPYYTSWDGHVCGPELFHVIKEIGRGEYGVVMRAEFKEGNRPVAIKYVSDPENYKYAINEVCMLSAFNHGLLPKLYCIYKHAETMAIVMEFIDGSTLAGCIKAQSTDTNLKYLKPLLRDVGGFLSILHANNLAYSDMKPENIMVERDGEALRLVDFGFAGYTTVSNPHGSPLFLSPEAIKLTFFGDDGMIDPNFLSSNDWYGLGATAYEVTEGHSLIPAGLDGGSLMQRLLHGVQKGHFKDGKYATLFSGLLAPCTRDRWTWEQLSHWIDEN